MPPVTVIPSGITETDLRVRVGELKSGQSVELEPCESLTLAPLKDVLEWPADVPINGHGAATIKCDLGGRLHIPDPRSLRGFTVSGTDRADTPLVIGTGPGGPGAHAEIIDVWANNPGPDKPAAAVHNLQNSRIAGGGSRSAELGNGWIFDNGCKNIDLEWFCPTKCKDWGLWVGTTGGTQRTSKVYFRSGMIEGPRVAAIILEDQEYFLAGPGIAFNGGAGNTGSTILMRKQQVTSGGRVAGKPIAPRFDGLLGKQWGSVFKAEVPVALIHDGGGHQFGDISKLWDVGASTIVRPGMSNW